MQRLSLSLVVVALLGAVACSSPQTRSAKASMQPGQSVRVAACQIEVSDQLERNFASIEQALLQAKDLGAHIACFPETSLLGWVNPNAHQHAEPIPGTASMRLGDLAQQYGLMIAIGLAEQDNGRLYDSAILLDVDGSLLLKHRKANILTELMDPPYTAGDGSASVASTRFGRIGLLICADTFRPDVVSAAAAVKPDLMLVPYGWAAPKSDWPNHGRSLQAWVSNTARQTGAPVVGVDATGSIAHGPWTGYLYGGQSVVSASDGRVLGVMADRQPQVQVFDLQL